MVNRLTEVDRTSADLDVAARCWSPSKIESITALGKCSDSPKTLDMIIIARGGSSGATRSIRARRIGTDGTFTMERDPPL
jgi:hypothetical protein